MSQTAASNKTASSPSGTIHGQRAQLGHDGRAHESSTRSESVLANKLFQLVARRGVQAIVLHVGCPPRALVNNEYRDLSAQLLREHDVRSVITAAGGQQQLSAGAQGSAWTCQLDGVGTVRLCAGYDGVDLKATLHLLVSAAGPVQPNVAAMNASPRTVVAHPVVEVVQPEPPRRRAPAPISTVRPVVNPSDFALQTNASGRCFDGTDVETPARSEVDLHEAFHVEPAQIWEPRHTLTATPAVEHASSRTADPALAGDLLDELLGRARERNASDVHVLADRPPMFRIAGELAPQGAIITRESAEQLLMARVPTCMRGQLERHGSCDFSLIHPTHGRFRANVTRQRTGLKLTARVIGRSIPTLAELGLPDSISRALHYHHGLIVITGPTGHGKTTTLAAIVGMLNRETARHVITVEDPIEYVHGQAKAVISQREVGTHTKSFQNALKGSLREDPDVIVVGELRDTETVRMALTASETGHLVISTMNTPSAAKAIERLIDLFPPGDQPQVRMTLAGGLRLIISQRLVPSADRKALCAAAEILPGCLPLWNLIRDNRTYQIGSLQQRGKSLGIVRLDDSLADLVRSGKTTLELAREMAETPEHFEALVMGRAVSTHSQDEQPARNAPSAAQRVRTSSTLMGFPAAIPSQKGKEFSRSMLSRAGRLLGGDAK